MPLQIHTMDADEWTEVDVAEGLVEEIEDAELFLYQGSAHLFADSSLHDYKSRRRLLKQRALAFLHRVG